jgi:archaellum biogenesis ATPase FlaH
VSAWTEWLSSLKKGKNPCYRCRKNGRDRSGDNYHHYGEGLGGYCNACGFTQLSDDEREARGYDNVELEEEEEVSTKNPITDEENAKLKSYTGIQGKGYRGIRDEINAYFGVRYEYDEGTGEPIKQYVPVTKGSKLVGYKTRKFPKDFTNPIGQTGKDCDLIGQFRFMNSTGILLITGGEIKQLAAYQMLLDSQKSKSGDKYDPVAVVSPSIGESGAAKQVANHYSWLCQFTKIIVCMDMDEAGKASAGDLCKVLPKGKAYVMNMRYKDADEYIRLGREDEFIKDFWKAKQYTPDGILSSADLPERARSEASIEKVPLPPFMHRLQKLMAGGIPLGRIVNLGSASGTGKSTIVDEMVYYWLFNSPHRVGIISLESDAGQYWIKLMSRHIERKIDLIETVEDKLELMSQDWYLDKEGELAYDNEGQTRFHLMEDRDGGVDSLKNCIESLVVSCGCKVIILDPLQDVLDGLSNEEQAVFLRWMKGTIKTYGVTFINVNHVRKSGGGQKANSAGADLHEEDFSGSSTIFKSGACNLIFTRNKEAEDEIERNTTIMKMSKCRWTGHTSPFAGKYYYDNTTHKLYDFDDWCSKQKPSKF